MSITVIFKILILLFYTNIVYTNHFQGGTITYKIVNTYGSTVSVMITQTYLYKWGLVYCDNARILLQSTPNSTSFAEYKYNLTCVSNCTTTGGYKPVPVRTYCTDYSAPMAISVTQRTDIVNITTGAYFTVAFVSSAWRTLSLPTGNITSKGWSVACTIDLRIRSDTGKINTPPVATMISPIYIPVANRTSLIVPTIDSDGDVVRCRFANTNTECANVCPPDSLPNNTILVSSDCTLYITGANVNDWYAVAIQIEDFASASSTTPLSSVPVQFLINVYAVPSCTKAPLLYGPYNETGACEILQVGQAHTLILYAENYCSSYGVTIKDIATLSFPVVTKSNIVQNTSTLYSVTLKWTPTANQVGSQILCAVAIDSQNIQSNQYCVAFVVSENSSTAACPVEVVETTTSITTMEQTLNTFASIINTLSTGISYKQSTTDDTTSVTISTADETTSVIFSTADETTSVTISTADETTSVIFSTADETTSMTTTTIITTTKTSSSNEWPWLLPLVSVFASLIPPICCLCICCPPPYGYGLLYRKRDQDKPSKPLPKPEQVRRPPRMYMIRRIFGKNIANDSTLGSSLASSRSTTISDQDLDGFPLTLRNNRNKTGKNVVWVYPSLPSDNTRGRDSSLTDSRSTTVSDKHSDRFPLTLRNSRNKTRKNVVWVHPSPRSDSVGENNDSLTDSINTTASDKHSDRFPLTLRNSGNRTGKNVVWVHPSPRFNNDDELSNSLARSRSTAESEIQLDLSTPKPHP